MLLGAINGPSRIYGTVEASTDSLELSDKDLFGGVGPFLLLKTAWRHGRAEFLGIITGREFVRAIMWVPLSKASEFLL